MTSTNRRNDDHIHVIQRVVKAAHDNGYESRLKAVTVSTKHGHAEVSTRIELDTAPNQG